MSKPRIDGVNQSLAFMLRRDILDSGVADGPAHDSPPLLTQIAARDWRQRAERAFAPERADAERAGEELGDVVSGGAGMTQPAKANEPSMEDILASIRRIIADDDTAKPSPAPAEPANAAPMVNKAPLASVPKPVAPAASAAKPAGPVAAPQKPAAPLASVAAERPAAQNAVPVEPAVGGADDRAADVLELTEDMTAPAPPSSQPAAPAASAPLPAFRTIDGNSDIGFADSPDNAQALPEPPRLMSASTGAAVDSAFNALAQTVLVHNARTLEDLVREMLRPMLKSWLDENLPNLVERMVRAEIERVSRGR